MILDGIAADIEGILGPYLSINSETGTDGEKETERFLVNKLGGMEYFREHPDDYGAFPVPGDPCGRSVCWALVRGKGARTVVLLHHYDAVNTDDFKTLKGFALCPAALEKELLRIKDTLPSEAAEDLASGEFLFGRGTADMKAGGAIQIALLDRFSKEEERSGNLLLLALPDEENLSAGMRGAAPLLSELQKRFSLRYVYAIDSEPHQRKDRETGLISEGSVGKILAFVYVRGVSSHAGKVFDGLNPLSVLCRIAAATELSPGFSDAVHGEACPPPTWLYLRDRKKNYDVSMPQSAGGCMSILTFFTDPREIMKKLTEVSLKAFSETIDHINESFETFCENSGRKKTKLSRVPIIRTFSELLGEAIKDRGDLFPEQYGRKLKEINTEIKNGKMDFIEASFLIAEFVYDFIDDLSPCVTLGFVPPYYPSASNIFLDEGRNACPGLADKIIEYALGEFSQRYDREYFFTGISDMSYCSVSDSEKIEKTLRDNMPLYGDAYSIPFSAIEEFSMPCMNIGPWGKDFHRITERVFKDDLYERTPALLAKAIEMILRD